MAILFTQYLFPHGRSRPMYVSRPASIEALAKAFTDSGGWFECEMFPSNGLVSLTACKEIEGEQVDVEIEFVKNGPEVPEAVDRLVKSSVRHIEVVERR